MRKTIIAGNWKMNHQRAAVRDTLTALTEQIKGGVKPEVIVAPAFAYLAEAVSLTKGTNVHIAAQNMHFEENGAYTGEVSPAMLVDVGVSHVILGHSERRRYFNETDETVNLKVKAAVAHDLTPLMCCGETLEQRENGKMKVWIEGQIKAGLAGISAADIKKVVIAYEPIWAIGTGRTANAEQAQEVCLIIRNTLAFLYGAAVAEAVPVLYGGSMNAHNVADLTAARDIDGGLVGGASLKAAEFAEIIAKTIVK